MSDTPLSRRRFLGSTAAGAAGLALASETEAAPDAGKPLRWGIIGTGARARIHFAALKAHPGMQIAAACDVDEGRLKLGLERIGRQVATFSDYRQLLAGDTVDAVVVATPNMFHDRIVIDSLRAGKHVLCEKPMATTLEGCAAILKAASQSPSVTLFGLQLRYAGRFREMARLLQSGKIGAPKYIEHTEMRGDWNSGNVWRYRDPKTGESMNWRYSQKASGGTMNEKSCHYFDIINWLAGSEPKRVYGRGGLAVYRDRETWDHATVHIDYANGVRAVHSLCMFAPHTFELRVIGDQGVLELMQDHVLVRSRTGKGSEKAPLPQEKDHGERGAGPGVETAVTRMYQEFLECVREKKKPTVSPAMAMASSKVAILAERSSSLGREVEWGESLD